MSTLNVIFDEIFVINLEKDIYKRNSIIDKFKKLNISFKFFDAVNGYETKEIIKAYNDYKNKPFDWKGSHKYEQDRQKKMIPSLGAYGYLQTWINILNLAKEKCYKNILVFDDDVIFDNNFEIKVNKFFSNIENFKIVSLGVSQHIWKNIVINDNYYHPIEFTDGSFAIGVDEIIYDELLDDCLKYNISFDSGPVRSIYVKYSEECYICYPNIVIADLSSSDISMSRDMVEYSNKFRWELENFDYIVNSNILVSIILTNYNSETLIKDSIESILNQTYKTIELIIVDDGSTDNSLDIISLYKDLFNVRVVSLNKNYGCYFAKNVGLLLSKGKFIGFQDADDISSPFRIEKQIKYLLENENVDMVFCDILKCDNIIDNFNSSLEKEEGKGYLGLITLLMRRGVLDKVGLYSDYYPHSMDQEFIDRYHFKTFNKLSEEHTHFLINYNRLDKIYKLEEILYLCNPYTSKNLSSSYTKSRKEFIREFYLKNIVNNDIKYLINIDLINFVRNNIGIIEDNHYLSYFVNNSKVRMDINVLRNNNNYVLIEDDIFNIKNNNKILTTNEIVYKYYNCDIQYFKMDKSYKNFLMEESNKKLIIELSKNEIYKDTFNKLEKNFNLDDFLRINNINQIFSKNYTNSGNTLFDELDLDKIKNHEGKKWILVKKLDLLNLYECLLSNVEGVIVLDKQIRDELCNLMIDNIYVNGMIEKSNFSSNFSKKCIMFNKVSKIYILNQKERLDKRKLVEYKLDRLGIYNYEIYNFGYKDLINKILSSDYNDEEYVVILEDNIIFNKDIDKYKLDLNEEVIYLGSTDNLTNVVCKISFLKKFVKETSNLLDFIVKNNVNYRVIKPSLVISNLKENNLTNYFPVYLDLFYYDIYKNVYDNKINLRMINNFNLDKISIKDISRIIEGENKTFVFIIASYNNELYVKRNLDSIFNQTYKLWRIIYIDDNSSDNTYNVVNDYIKKNNLCNKVLLIRNEVNMKQSYNRYVGYKLVDDDEIVCFLDGDDWLYDNNVLFRLNEEYKSDDILLTFGSYCEYINGLEGAVRKVVDYRDDIKNGCKYRDRRGWFGIPLRTGYGYLYKDIPDDYLKDCDGNWMRSCTDIAEFLWAIEKVDKRYKAIEWITYVYNIDSSRRFSNSMYNLSESEYKYRIDVSEKIFSYKKLK